MMESARIARRYLMANAVFSLVLGVDFLIAPGVAADFLFEKTADWQLVALRILGSGLVIFGIDLVLMARNRFLTKAQVLLITLMDIGWVAASALLLLVEGDVFTVTGQALIVGTAVIVSIFAFGQYVGAQRMSPLMSEAAVTFSNGTIHATVCRAVDAPEEVVWRVMNDHPGYADVADNLSRVEVVSGEGIGMQRRCYGPKGENWLETCDRYEEGRAYGFRIHTEAVDYPYPISDLHGEWTVERNGKGSKFAIAIDAEPKGNLLVRTLFKWAAKRQFRVVLADLADAWAARMEREAQT